MGILSDRAHVWQKSVLIIYLEITYSTKRPVYTDVEMAKPIVCNSYPFKLFAGSVSTATQHGKMGKMSVVCKWEQLWLNVILVVSAIVQRIVSPLKSYMCQGNYHLCCFFIKPQHVFATKQKKGCCGEKRIQGSLLTLGCIWYPALYLWHPAMYHILYILYNSPPRSAPELLWPRSVIPAMPSPLLVLLSLVREGCFSFALISSLSLCGSLCHEPQALGGIGSFDVQRRLVWQRDGSHGHMISYCVAGLH